VQRRARPCMPQALHEQLSGILRSRILSGDVGPGTALPTEHQLMQIYEVSRSVVRQAMQVLEWEGLVTRNPGRGTFVREQSKSPISTYAGWSLGSLDELLAFGLQTRLTVLGKNEVAADAQVSSALEISRGRRFSSYAVCARAPMAFFRISATSSCAILAA
jgi:GntR family transcriptional regulator